MKHINKQNIPSRLLAAIILSAVLVLVIAATVVVTVVAKNSGEPSHTTNVSKPPEILEDEATQNGLALAYPMINNKQQIAHIEVENSTGKFGFIKYANDNYFTLYYFEEGSDEPKAYVPGICDSEDGFNYSSLFAIETGDGYSQYTLVDYLCMALQSPYFYDRVKLAEGETEAETLALREKQYKEYGLDGTVQRVIVNYTDAFGNDTSHIIKIGRKSATGTGHYFMVDDRPYIYSSLNNFFDYALKNMTEYLKPLLVAEGIPSDKGFGPYLTTDYRQWLNKLHDGSCECDKYECACRGECTADNCECESGCRVTVTDDESKVIAYTDVISTTPGADGNGYVSTGVDLIEIDLANAKDWLESARYDYKEYLKDYEEYSEEYEQYKLDYEALSPEEQQKRHSAYVTYVRAYEKYKRNFENYKLNYENQKQNYERMISVLANKEIGKYSGADELVYTIVSPGRVLDFAGKASLEYEYVITEIEAILTDSGEVSQKGVSAGSIGSSLVKITYTASLGGKPVSDKAQHAVIDLNSTAMPTAASMAIAATPVGECSISFKVNYTADNSFARNGKYTVVEITDIYDQSFKEIDKVTVNSIVGFRYKIEVDGVYVGEYSMFLDLSSAETKIKNAFKGRAKGSASFILEEQSVYYEMFMNFSTYKVSEIDSFVTRELITAFKFQNSSERDPYYGESLYENCMTDEHKLYGLNSSVCETVVKILGGLSDESTSATASGLSGDKVVAVGLTPEVKKEIGKDVGLRDGLYAYTIYFELPRGITAYEPENESGEDILDDYKHDSTLGFYLYISEVDPTTNMRYIGSNLYDVVTRVPAEDFVFLDYDFETFWARRNIILMNVADINYFGINFNLEDVKGEYMFELLQPGTSDGNLEISVSADGECTPNKLIEYLNDPKYNKHDGAASIKAFYEYMSSATAEDYKLVLPDSLGVANFKEAMRMIYFMSYVDVMPEDKRVGDPDNMVMQITLKLEQTTKNASPYTYVYEFYTVDDYDRRILVTIHQENDEGERVGDMQVSDFYISMFTFKKIVDNFTGILNAEIIEPNIGYIGDSEK